MPLTYRDENDTETERDRPAIRVLSFPAQKQAMVGHPDVERINQFEFFELGEILQKIKDYGEGNNIPNNAIFSIFSAHTAVEGLVNGKPLELTVSKACAIRLRDALWSFLDQHFRESTEDGKRIWKFPKADDEPIGNWNWHSSKTALLEFETIFREEMREAAIYRVPQRGIYDTGKLIDSADQSFPAEVTMCIPLKTREDWKAAGRCLAFNLLSASGFHVARAVEGTMEAYYQASYGLNGKSGKRSTLTSWGDYIKKLEEAKDANPPKAALVPSEKVISEIRQMKDDYRNPIAHPRIVLTEPDARMLFANGESLIIAMAQEMKVALPTPNLLKSYGLTDDGIMTGEI